MKLSLVIPAYTVDYGAFAGVASSILPLPPLNICILGALAKHEGWDVQVIDAEIEKLNDDQLIERIFEFKSDIVGFTATTPFFHNIERITKKIKERSKMFIIVGGPHVSIFKEKSFLQHFDCLFIGESEEVFPLFLQHFASNKREFNIKGIMYRNYENTIVYHGDTSFVEDLNSIPFPDHTLLKRDLYKMSTPDGVKKLCSMIQMSRGCPYQCVYCANALYGKKIRRRGLDNVIEELIIIIKNRGIEHIYFSDDTLTYDRGYMLALCDKIEELNLKFTFEGHTRADLWDEHLAKRLQAIGLVRISFGLESADPRIKKIINKNIPLEKYIEASKINNKLGIETMTSVMLGLPGENRESIKTTVDFLCKTPEIKNVTYGIAIPYPGTEMLKMAERNEYGLKILDKDFSKYHRYGYSVMQVGDISPKEMIVLQQKGLIRIYLCWWRLLPMLKLHGFFRLLPPAFYAIKAIFSQVYKRSKNKVKHSAAQ
ncbi:MAG: radical SAM protein [Oligoflexia bacterium]|nr:radical SAM protein [Oligoflexia bacterium]